MKLLAQIQINGTPIQAPNGVPTGGIGTSGKTFFAGAIEIAFIFAIVLALISLTWSGIQWIMSGGDKQKIQSARNRIIFTIVGLIVVLISFFIINVVGGLFGINNITAPGP